MPKRKKVVRVLNCVPSEETERDWLLEHAARAGAIAAAGPLPAAVDLRESWWKVGDQGSTGACVGWAVGDGLLRWHFVKAGKLAQTDTISPRFVWMASKETDDSTTRPTTFIDRAGTSIKSALDVGRKYGSVREYMLPFSSAKLYAGQLETFYAAAALRKLSSYFNLGDDQDRWRRWLAEQGPVVTRLDVDKTWDDAKANAGNLDEYKANTKRGGHAVSLVGYTADRFIVRNSWGTGWGDAGFGYASTDYAGDAFTEAYGVVV